MRRQDRIASGQITTIAAHSELTLVDKDAVVADKSNTTSNSALTGLTTVDGDLLLVNGATVTTSAGLTNSGSIYLDLYTDDGGSSLTVGGGLTNDGTLAIGPSNDTLTSATTVSATSITNFVSTTFGDRRLRQRQCESPRANPGCAGHLRRGGFRRRRQGRRQRQRGI